MAFNARKHGRRAAALQERLARASYGEGEALYWRIWDRKTHETHKDCDKQLPTRYHPFALALYQDRRPRLLPADRHRFLRATEAAMDRLAVQGGALGVQTSQRRAGGCATLPRLSPGAFANVGAHEVLPGSTRPLPPEWEEELRRVRAGNESRGVAGTPSHSGIAAAEGTIRTRVP